MTKQVFPRTVSRLAAVQANFQQLLRPDFPIESIIQEFLHHRFTPQGYPLFQEDPFLLDQDFFIYIATGANKAHPWIEEIIARALPDGWNMEQMENTTRSIFRCAGFEIHSCPSTPKGVILNEYITAAHCFLLDKGHGLVNAVLDKAFDGLRAYAHVLPEHPQSELISLPETPYAPLS
jgi:transcription antitermination factor NusB